MLSTLSPSTLTVPIRPVADSSNLLKKSGKARVFDDDPLEGRLKDLREALERLGETPPRHFSRTIEVRPDWNRSPLPSLRGNAASSSQKTQGLDHTESSLDYASALQREYDEEDRRLEQERLALQYDAQEIFDCAICFDNLPIEDVAFIPECDHFACRDCLRQYILTTLHDHRFPILCPLCTDGETKTSLPETLIRDIGISKDDFLIWEELQMSTVSILVHCRRCQNSAFVDRIEYQESSTIKCPLPKCEHKWCKSCSQTIDTAAGAPKHSCDGTSELDHLMKQQGWKYCPGCRTPVQKTSRCNYMTCIAPGCNFHFCYLCGLRHASSDHNSRCAVPNV
ncbi:hypothetical protein IW261DRAFT_1609518 [Armillaria novae-zelandiae]|uniref:RBR-type E3 ubiquitin transferase n=1 Tax=Armillaria novae-zelandiae TaxID=153914 RepID=A0AA39UC54_9AGAR|nr:hypothetical protein IW261DRAFT_1609518 [Armillaria novae-zelandiae]